jgi:hypothetical protein
MGHAEMERDLAYIKRTMEVATRYDNIPPAGYLLTGLLGLAGAGGTYLVLGADGARRIDDLTAIDLWQLGALWSGVLVLALVILAVAAVMRARHRGIAAWNSLATRMFVSKLPHVVAAGLLTVALVRLGHAGLIPALWLLQYGVITYSFSYFAGRDHQLLGAVLIALGAAALFGPGSWSLPLLAVGLGLGHLVFGVARMIRNRGA